MKRPRPRKTVKTICLRGFSIALHAEAKEQAKAEGMLIRDWFERAVIRELALARSRQAKATEAI